jgi:CDP-glycerol glycerophosphotransferase
MKIDKKNPSHWFLLALFGLNVLLAMLMRPLRKPEASGRKTLVLYGHKLSGNLLAIQRHLLASYPADFSPVFLTMDKAYRQQLNAEGTPACFAGALACANLLARADALISDHGLHAMQLLLGRTDLRFFDVWHGIPFKGFDADDFRVQHRYDQTWVASPLMAELYRTRFGFDPSRIRVTGYARTDALVAPNQTPTEIRHQLGLQHTQGQRLVLFAPTWKQDAQHRSLFPFGKDGAQFLTQLAEVCRQNNALLLFRAHLNANQPVPLPAEGVIPVPFAQYPDTEALLQISDLLICDWSSIAFDYLLLDRPTLFLDVEPPFRKGFSLGPEYRFGPVVKSLDELLEKLHNSLAEPSGYWQQYQATHTAIRQQIYGDYADGQAAERCVKQLKRALSVRTLSKVPTPPGSGPG